MEKRNWKIENGNSKIGGESGAMLGRTGCGKDQDLAGAEAIGVAQLGIGLGDAGPGGAAAQLRSGNFPESVAALDGDAWGLRAGTKIGSGDDQQHAGLDVIWIGDGWIRGEKFVPAGAAAEMAAREFPERVAGQDADCAGAESADGRSGGRGARSESWRRGKRLRWEQ